MHNEVQMHFGLFSDDLREDGILPKAQVSNAGYEEGNRSRTSRFRTGVDAT